MRQYRVVAESTKKLFEEELNKLAEEGWEIIHYGNSVSVGSTRSNTMACFSAILEKEKTVTRKKVKTSSNTKKTSTEKKTDTSSNDYSIN